MSKIINNRYEFVYFFDVENGNPNGDPDAGNMPRIDPETNHGIVTDVCLKRKVRNFVYLTQYRKENEKDANPNEKEFRIYVQEKAILNQTHDRAYKAIGVEKKEKREGGGESVDKARNWMCAKYYDVRSFGAVMSTGTNCGQVTGPIQINFAKSIEPVVPLEFTITRCAVATEEEAKKQEGGAQTMGRKHILPYGLYRAEGYISANFAQKTGFNEDDLNLFWEALINMFEHDHSAARGKMNARKLFVFKHESPLGNAPAHKLFELITVKRSGDTSKPARAFSDYKVEVNEAVPKGVVLEEKL